MMIDLSVFIENPELAKNIRLEVSGSDLLAFGQFIHDRAIKEAISKLKQNPETYLTPREVADLLHISLVTLWSWDKKKITTPVYIGNKKLYERSSLDKLLKTNS